MTRICLLATFTFSLIGGNQQAAAEFMARSVPKYRIQGCVAIDTKTGKLAWSQFPDAGRVLAVANKGQVYAIVEKGCQLLQLDAKSGKVQSAKPLELWTEKTKVNWQIGGPKLQTLDAGMKNRLVASYHVVTNQNIPRHALIDADDGRVVAKWEGRFVASQDVLYVDNPAPRDDAITAIEIHSGKKRWSVNMKHSQVFPIDNGVLVVGRSELALFAASDGKAMWRCNFPRHRANDHHYGWHEVLKIANGVALVKGEDYLANNHRECLAAIDLKNGKVQWLHPRIHFHTRYGWNFMAPYLKEPYRQSFQATDFPAIVVDDQVVFCDGHHLVSRPLGEGDARRIWPPNMEELGSRELYFYLPAKSGWYLSSVDIPKNKNELTKANRTGEVIWQFKNRVGETIRPIVENEGRLFANYYRFEGGRGFENVVDFGMLVIDAKTGELIERRSMEAIQEEMLDDLTARGMLPVRRGVVFSMPKLPVDKLRVLQNSAIVKMNDLSVVVECGPHRWASHLTSDGDADYVTVGEKLLKVDFKKGDTIWQADARNVSAAAFSEGLIIVPSPPRDASGNVIQEILFPR